MSTSLVTCLFTSPGQSQCERLPSDFPSLHSTQVEPDLGHTKDRPGTLILGTVE